MADDPLAEIKAERERRRKEREKEAEEEERKEREERERRAKERDMRRAASGITLSPRPSREPEPVKPEPKREPVQVDIAPVITPINLDSGGAPRFCRECGRKETNGSVVRCLDCGTMFRVETPEPAKVEVKTAPQVDTSKDSLARAQSFQTYGKLNQKKEDAPQVALVWQNVEENLKCPTEVKVVLGIVDQEFRVRSEHPDLYLFTELKFDRKTFPHVTLGTVKHDLRQKNEAWPAFNSGCFINKKYYNDETTMAGAGIKGFSTTGEMYTITFVLLAPVEKSNQPMKIALTSPRDRPIDTSGRFCKECGTKASSDVDKNCRVCGTTLPVATRSASVQVDSSTVHKAQQSRLERESHEVPRVLPSEAKKTTDQPVRASTLAVLPNKRDKNVSSSTVEEVKPKSVSLADIDSNLHCLTEVKVIPTSIETVFRVKSEHPDLYSFAELKYDKKKFSSITFETIKSDLKAKDWPALRSGCFVGKQYFDDETTMLSAGIKGFASTGEMYAVTFVLAAPIEKGSSQIKVAMTSPRDRKIDTTGRFCKECGTKSNNDNAKVCHVCGSSLPAVVRNVVQVDADAISRVADQQAKKEAAPYVSPSADVRSGSSNDAKKDAQAKPGRVRAIEDKDPSAPEQSFIVEQKAKSLADIDANLKCPVELKVVTNNYDTLFRARCEHPNLYLYTELKYDKKIFSGVTFAQVKGDLNAKEWPEFEKGVYVGTSFFDDESSMLGSGIKGFSSSGEDYALTFIMRKAVATAKSPSVVSLTSPRNTKIDTSGKFCKECGAKASNEEQKSCRTCGTAFPANSSRGPQVQVDANALLANKK